MDDGECSSAPAVAESISKQCGGSNSAQRGLCDGMLSDYSDSQTTYCVLGKTIHGIAVLVYPPKTTPR